MSMSKKQIIEKAEVIAEELSVMELLTPEISEIVDSMSMDATAPVLTEALNAVKAMRDAIMEDGDNLVDSVDNLEKLEDMEEEIDRQAEYQPVWRCGQGTKEIILAAPTQAEALDELMVIEPVFKAIGAVAERLETKEGYPIFAKVK